MGVVWASPSRHAGPISKLAARLPCAIMARWPAGGAAGSSAGGERERVRSPAIALACRGAERSVLQALPSC